MSLADNAASAVPVTAVDVTRHWHSPAAPGTAARAAPCGPAGNTATAVAATAANRIGVLIARHHPVKEPACRYHDAIPSPAVYIHRQNLMPVSEPLSLSNCSSLNSDMRRIMRLFVLTFLIGLMLWSGANAQTGTSRAAAGSDATVTSVSCASAGNCAAGGRYFDASLRAHAFVLIERNGRWGRAIEVPGLAAGSPKYADISSVSCAPAGGCAAGGYYQDASSRYHAFVTNERNGKWGRLTTVFSARAKSVFTRVRSLSCPAPGRCTVGGGRPPFVVNEVKGRWSRAIQLPTKDKNGSVVVSCASAGNCAAGWGTFVVRERNGRWGRPVRVPGLSALGTGAAITSVSCTSAVNCAVGGSYGLASGATEVFVASERRGRWGKAIEVPGFTALNQEGSGDLASVSCVSAGNCVAGGDYAAPADFQGGAFEAFVASERDGRWGKAIEVPGIPPPSTGICQPDSNSCVAGRVLSVSCAADRICAVGGWYDTPAISGQVAFVASYKNGRWGKVTQIPGLEALDTAKSSQVNSVSCPPVGSCAAGGSYSTTEPLIGPAFVVSENNGTWNQTQTVRF